MVIPFYIKKRNCLTKAYNLLLGIYRNQAYMRARATLQEMQAETSITVQDVIKSDFLTGHDVNLFRKVNRYQDKKKSYGSVNFFF